MHRSCQLPIDSTDHVGVCLLSPHQQAAEGTCYGFPGIVYPVSLHNQNVREIHEVSAAGFHCSYCDIIYYIQLYV